MKAIAVFEMPKSCNDCPCVQITEGAYHDYCGILGYETEFKETDKIYSERIENCPLKELKDDRNNDRIS